MGSLDLTSSMEPIRNAALLGKADEARRAASVPKRSRLWSDSSQVVSASQSALSQAARMPSKTNESVAPDPTPKSGARAITRNIVASDPTLLAVPKMDKTDNPRQPRFFGNTTRRAASETAVRCGGFHKMDWPVHQTAAKQKS